ncbi:MAG: uroporphyrinogen decarboxylase family protein [Armatimonadota bacterium]
MNSKERFAVTCEFGVPDRVAVDYMAHRKIDEGLKQSLGCESEEDLLDRLGVDFYYLPCRDISQNEGFMPYWRGPALDVTDVERTCALGIRWHRGAGAHKFSVDEAISGPLENAETEADILAHRWPTAADFDFSALEAECDAHSDRVIIGGLWTGIMGDSYRLHGFQNFLTNIALRPELIKTLVNRVTQMYLELNDAIFSQLKGKIDVWFFGNDFGSQNGLLLREEMWHEFFFEPIKSLAALAHSHGLNVMMHSCGGISEIVPHLIEAGVDVLDPIQLTARGMEPEGLAEKFGGKIVFHGGVDTQQILPFGTPEEVRAHAGEVMRVLGRKGGYILAPSQILGPDIPVENVIAMYAGLAGFSPKEMQNV